MTSLLTLLHCLVFIFYADFHRLTFPRTASKSHFFKRNSGLTEINNEHSDKSSEFSSTSDETVAQMQSLRQKYQKSAETEDSERKNDPSCCYGDSTAYLVLLYSFIQDLSLIHTQSHTTSELSQLNVAKELFQSVFLFKLDLLYPGDSVCFLGDGTPVVKLLLQLSQFGAIFALLVLLKLVSSFLARILRSVSIVGAKMEEKVSVAMALCLLTFYQRLSLLFLKLIHCIEVDETPVLHADGNLQCYSGWQIAVLCYLCLFLLPMPFYIATVLSNQQTFSLLRIYIGCAVPSVALVCELAQTSCSTNQRRASQSSSTAPQMPPAGFIHGTSPIVSSRDTHPTGSAQATPPASSAHATWRVLRGCCRDLIVTTRRRQWRLWWTGVALLLRLLLVVVHIFVLDQLIKVQGRSEGSERATIFLHRVRFASQMDQEPEHFFTQRLATFQDQSSASSCSLWLV